VANAAGIDDKDLAKARPVACGQGKELAFDVIDDDTSRPGQKLGGGEKPLAAPRWRGNEHIPQFPPFPGWPNAKHLTKRAHT
jgi:hypothetical protein